MEAIDPSIHNLLDKYLKNQCNKEEILKVISIMNDPSKRLLVMNYMDEEWKDLKSVNSLEKNHTNELMRKINHYMRKTCHLESDKKGKIIWRYGHKGLPPASIDAIQVDQKKAIISIETSRSDSIAWKAGGKIIGTGNQFNIKNIPADFNYVRAEIYGASHSVVCTQPFIIKKLK